MATSRIGRVTRIAFLLLLALDLIDARIAEPLLVVLLATVGISHGAVDHLIPHRLGWNAAPLRVAAIYLVGLIAAFVAYLTWPTAGYAALLLLSWWHFGSADAAFVGPSKPFALQEVLVFGLLPLALPLTNGSYRGPVLLTVFGVIAITLLVDCLRGRGARWHTASLLDLAVLYIGFGLGAYPFAFGAYFVAWHAPRHVARIITLDSQLNVVEASKRFLREALPFTLAGIAFTIVAFGAVTITHRGSLLQTAYALIFAVTVPHQVIVALMDRGRRGPSSWQVHPARRS